MELAVSFSAFLLFLFGIFLHTTETAQQCVSCSTMTNIDATAAVKNILSTYNTPLCETREADFNKSGIGVEMCESVSDIYGKKSCGILKGFVNGTAFDQHMSLNLFYRGCIGAKLDQPNGCQISDNDQMDLMQNLRKVFQPLQKYNIKTFKGQRCLCKSNSCDISSSSPPPHHHHLSFHSQLWIATTVFSLLLSTIL